MCIMLLLYMVYIIQFFNGPHESIIGHLSKSKLTLLPRVGPAFRVSSNQMQINTHSKTDWLVFDSVCPGHELHPWKSHRLKTLPITFFLAFRRQHTTSTWITIRLGRAVNGAMRPLYERRQQKNKWKKTAVAVAQTRARGRPFFVEYHQYVVKKCDRKTVLCCCTRELPDKVRRAGGVRSLSVHTKFSQPRKFRWKRHKDRIRSINRKSTHTHTPFTLGDKITKREQERKHTPVAQHNSVQF